MPVASSTPAKTPELSRQTSCHMADRAATNHWCSSSVAAYPVRVLETPDVWYGMTYREDLPAVRAAFRKMHEMGIYGENLFDEMKEKE